MKRRIEIAEHDPNWINKYKTEIVIITKILEREIVRDHHIGSTSVMGLSAKPIIDILLEFKIKNLNHELH